MESKLDTGTCIHFGPTFGFIGVGIFTNGRFEDRVYVHYKNIKRSNLRDKGFRELKAGDVVEFEYADGYFCDKGDGDKGTQAINVKVISFAENNEQERSEPNA